ncbi:hypothetical protein Kpol_541p39 [Vanderwaltozyma polyspora DSM 70294]|uniref:C2H2-type domain-containing protein n=1 Tax=Vanderwaltozyma polyspora (strain ATCC 22028 / DSM 70294 / BCRC 21397 / CBS 2163 / NBRC 10782 / NRRL Y-8283 / UCD 57-17) TaxID=436907 RepID=A7TIY5_VANPO|nr:uncharacterized protein Kpol_541p39 [Vanderwaltozyma polyspora DSM 70294]EDO17797.1 hypothetical protein Kpol_541p39 [Vanderwaltozyma polyspora DSM 70294]
MSGDNDNNNNKDKDKDKEKKITLPPLSSLIPTIFPQNEEHINDIRNLTHNPTPNLAMLRHSDLIMSNMNSTVLPMNSPPLPQQQQPLLHVPGTGVQSKYIPINNSVIKVEPEGSMPMPAMTSPSSSSINKIGKKAFNSEESKKMTLLRKQCHICKKICSRPATLKTHLLIHTGDTPFKCPWENCPKSFNVKSNMLRHLKSHQRKQVKLAKKTEKKTNNHNHHNNNNNSNNSNDNKNKKLSSTNSLSPTLSASSISSSSISSSSSSSSSSSNFNNNSTDNTNNNSNNNKSSK